MQTWHDGLQSELPVMVSLPRRPGMRVARSEAANGPTASFRDARDGASEARPAEPIAASAT